MKRGYTLIELMIAFAIIIIVVSIFITNCRDWHERRRCLRGEDVPTGASVCVEKSANGNYCEKYAPETRFVCHEWKAEEEE